jgi:hypothetical protein
VSKVEPLRLKDLTPAMVLEDVVKAAEELTEIYIVGVDKSGENVVWCTSDLTRLPWAAMVLNDLALKYLNGCVESE